MKRIYRFAADPRQSLWLAAVAVMTILVWRIARATIGLMWVILPPIAVWPLVAAAVLTARVFLPPFRPLSWAARLAVLALVSWFLLPAGALPRWQVGGAISIPLTALVPTAFFLLTALLGRSPFARVSERWVLGWRPVPGGERKTAWRFFRRAALFDWGLHKVPSEKLRFRFAFKRTVAALTFIAVMALPFAKQWMLKGVSYDFSSVTRFDPPTATQVRSADGKTICRFALEEREMVSLDAVPPHVRQAFIAAEDQHFYKHDGIDPVAIVRAARHNLVTHGTGQGGSTVSQQVVKQLILRTSEKSFKRKFREWLLVVELERMMPKDRILEVYLNHIYLGRAYGIQAAARAYFGKDVSQLTVGEAAFLGGMPKGPSQYSPSMHYQRAKARQAYVLQRMAALGFIDETERKAALASDVAVVMDTMPINQTAAPYFCAFVRRQLETAYGFDAVFKKGLLVETTLDLKMQEAAEAAVRNGLIDLERKIGFGGPEGHDDDFAGCDSRATYVRDDSIEVSVVTSVVPGVTVCVNGESFRMHPDDQRRIEAWQRQAQNELKIGDILSVKVQTFAREKGMPKDAPQGRFATTARRTAGKGHPEALQAALISIEPRTGFIKAMVGGYDFNENQYNVAVQAHRQTGSSVKPYIYLTALRRGTVVTDVVNDHPVCYPTASGQWCPQNYLGPHTAQRYMGAVDLRTALAKSLNSVSVQLLANAGVDEGLATMRALGINSPIPRVLPIAVGALDLTPWEHTAAYAGIAAGGKRLPSQFGNATPGIFIRKVTDEKGRTLYAYEAKPMVQAVPAGAAYALIHLMKGVVEFGTGHRVRELGRPAAGKTGTTNEFKDAWFMGFTADLVTGVWVGRMTPTPIAKEATGGAVALPIWLGFMEAAHPHTPPREFSVPSDIVLMTGAEGKPLPFQRGRVPAKYLLSAKSE